MGNQIYAQSSEINQKSHAENVVKKTETTLNTSGFPAELENKDQLESSTCTTEDIYESADESLHFAEPTAEASPLNLTQLADEFEQVHLSTPKNVRPGDSKTLGLLFASPAHEEPPLASTDSSGDDDNHSVATTTLSGDLSSNSFTFTRGESDAKIVDEFVIPEPPVHSLSVDNSRDQTDELNAATFFSDSNVHILSNDSPLSTSCVSGFSDSPDIHSSTRFISNSISARKERTSDDSCSPLACETSNLDSPRLDPSVEVDSIAVKEEDFENKERLPGVSELKIEEKLLQDNSVAESPALEILEFREAHLVLDEAPLNESHTSESSLGGNITVRENSLCAQDNSFELLAANISTEIAEEKNLVLTETVSEISAGVADCPALNSAAENQVTVSDSIEREIDPNHKAESDKAIADASRRQSEELEAKSVSFSYDEKTIDATGVKIDPGSPAQICDISRSDISLKVSPFQTDAKAEEEEEKQGNGISLPGLCDSEVTEIQEIPENRDNSRYISAVSENNLETSDISQRVNSQIEPPRSNSDSLSELLVKEELNCQEIASARDHVSEESNIKEEVITRNDCPENHVESGIKTEELTSAEPHITSHPIREETSHKEITVEAPVDDKIEPQVESIENKVVNSEKSTVSLEEERPNDLEKSYQEILETCAKQERELMSGMAGDFAESIKAEAEKLVDNLQDNGDEESQLEYDSFDDILPPQNMMLTSLCGELNSEAGPITADEDFNKNEFCENAADFLDCEFLSNIGKNGTASELKRKSLYVKFDPLLEHDDSFKLPEPQPTENNFDGDETIGGINTTFTLVPLTPAQNKKDAAKSNQSNSPLREELAKLQELMVQRERVSEQRETEALNLKLRIAELESLKTSDLTKIQEKIDCQDGIIEKLNKEKSALAAGNKDLVEVMHAYEKKISKMVAENEELTAKYEKEIDDIAKERDTAFQHLHNMELCFGDVHQKFEKAKEVILILHKNEKELIKRCDEIRDALTERCEAGQKLKQHAIAKINAANEEIDLLQRSHASEVSRLKAVAKKTDVHCKSLEEALEQKNNEILELTKICDELIGNK